MNFVLVVSALVVFAVFLGFEYIILMNRLVKKKESILAQDEKLLEWILLSQRLEILIKNLLPVNIPFSVTEFDSESLKDLDFSEKKTLVVRQGLSLKRSLGFVKNFPELAKSDEFFAQEKKIRSQIESLSEISRLREILVEKYNDSLKKSPIRSFSKMEFVADNLEI